MSDIEKINISFRAMVMALMSVAASAYYVGVILSGIETTLADHSKRLDKFDVGINAISIQLSELKRHNEHEDQREEKTDQNTKTDN